jgi:uncharacterized protein YhaN
MTDASKPISVPRVKVRRVGWFWCTRCGKEEKIISKDPSYVPLICVECSGPERERSKAATAEIAKALADLLPAAEAYHQDLKIAANEGRYNPQKLETMRKALEGLKDASDNLNARNATGKHSR